MSKTDQDFNVLNGIYMVGVKGCPDNGYSKGPTSCTNGHVVQYSHGGLKKIIAWKGSITTKAKEQ